VLPQINFDFILPQSAVGKASRQRAERLKLSANRHERTFPNLPRRNFCRVRSAIGKHNEAGNTRARLYHQFALSVSPYALPNFSRNFCDRADDRRQAAPRRRHVRTVERVRNRRQTESLKFSLSHTGVYFGINFVILSFLFLVRTFTNFALSQPDFPASVN
jgi:hypothetical protein